MTRGIFWTRYSWP